jgi:hypothetical protein
LYSQIVLKSSIDHIREVILIDLFIYDTEKIYVEWLHRFIGAISNALLVLETFDSNTP